MREVDVTGGKTNGRKEVRGDVTKRKTITRTMTGRKETGKKGTTEKAAGGKVSNQGDAKRRSYSEAVIEGALRTERGKRSKKKHLSKEAIRKINVDLFDTVVLFDIVDLFDTVDLFDAVNVFDIIDPFNTVDPFDTFVNPFDICDVPTSTPLALRHFRGLPDKELPRKSQTEALRMSIGRNTLNGLSTLGE
ncbi:hypothetical protein NP493_2116g00008 [Ridgeia piscesae]|uniref:Uncharacterized protein n=1 Tax=Ridgeia piscesae TaxID=27915 RepID=A0AAD9JLP5_RIDPI|nr:hypothetical protein NP493_2116g00008 [Ridgeia piscesae]